MIKIKYLVDKKGEIYVLVCVLMLVIVMTFSVIFTYSSVITEVKLQKTNTEIVFDSFVSNNSIIIFNNIKQGKNATNGIDTSQFNTTLKEFCTLDEYGGKLYCKGADGTERYSLTVPQMGFIEDEKLELFVTYTMDVPIRFAGQTVTTAHVPVKVTSELTGKN